MRLQFPVSMLSILRSELRQNPSATGVVLTKSELIDVVDELLQNGDGNAALLACPKRIFIIDGREIQVTIEAVKQGGAS